MLPPSGASPELPPVLSPEPLLPELLPFSEPVEEPLFWPLPLPLFVPFEEFVVDSPSTFMALSWVPSKTTSFSLALDEVREFLSTDEVVVVDSLCEVLAIGLAEAVFVLRLNKFLRHDEN